MFRKLIEIRCELADSLGYNSYIDLGYHIEGRQDYGTREIADFRSNIQKYVTPAVAEIKEEGIDFSHPSAIVANSGELISSISAMFQDLSYEAGSYFAEMTQKELYDLETRENKRSNLFYMLYAAIREASLHHWKLYRRWNGNRICCS